MNKSQYHKEWRKRNMEHLRIWSKKYALKNRARLLKYKRARYSAYKKENPMIFVLEAIKARCNNPGAQNYKWYGGRGIKCLITVEELKFLWKRDGGHLLEYPSIDRIDPNGHYTISNCRFIELTENTRRAAIRRNEKKSIVLKVANS